MSLEKQPITSQFSKQFSLCWSQEPFDEALALYLSDQKKHFIHFFPALSNQLQQCCELDALHHKCLYYPPSNPHSLATCHLLPSILIPTNFSPPAAPQSLSSPPCLSGSLPGSDHFVSPAPFLLLPSPLLPLPCPFAFLGITSAIGAVMSHHPTFLIHTKICLPCTISMTLPPPATSSPNTPATSTFPRTGEGFVTPQG